MEESHYFIYVHNEGAQTFGRIFRGLNKVGENVDFDSMWAVLASALQEIHTKNASNLSFEELYRNAYKLVLRKQGHDLYSKVKEFEERWLRQQVLPKIRETVSGVVLAGASGLLAPTVNEERIAGERFLRGLKEAWQEYILCMNMTTDVLMYMDRVYCVETRTPSIFIACMGLFRDCIIRPGLDQDDGQSAKVGDLLNSVILSLIRMEREGDLVDRHLIRSCMYMLEGLYGDEAQHESDRLYLTSFEPLFLDASRSFYKAQIEALLRETDAASLLKQVEKRFAEEQDRCRSTISPLTAPKIQAVMEDEIIRKHMRDVVDMDGSGAKYMFDNDRCQELGLLYGLIARVDAKKSELCRALSQRVVELGSQISRAAQAASAACEAPPTHADPAEAHAAPLQAGPNAAALQTTAAIKWVDEVLALKVKCDTILATAFAADHDLQAALTRGFASVVNAFPRSPEYISLFIDDNLRRSLKGKTEHEADEVLDKAIVLLRYVQDKDFFERYYKKHLSKRLLSGRSISHEVEKQMISKMKLELGNYFTQKLEGMFKDMSVSEDLSKAFKAHLGRLDGGGGGSGGGAPDSVELAVHVLTSTFWPLEVLDGSGAGSDGAAVRGGSCLFPPVIDRAKTSFEKFYLNKHTGRRLTWQANAGSADIRAIFPAVPAAAGHSPALSKPRRHELNVSTYAMVILLLFNDLAPGRSLTFEEIQAGSGIAPDELARNLQSLAVAPKTRILLKEPMSKEVRARDRFRVNDAFSSKFLKIKVGVVASANKVEGERERRDTERRNDEMRGGLIEAAVVRIMKGRKELGHQQLCAELIAQLAARFVPEMPMVKKRIESLIEREYLERVDGPDRAAYRYLA
ncbi:MAG: Cullin-3 [Phylliscum demangeonii]|nr:MAG: Cullin-3 [Phylliscum demangeonii]